MRVTVIGAGVIGLSTAARLLERGHDVRVLARERSPRTTSDVAAAIHFPFIAAPMERVLPWARATRVELARLAREEPGCGVVMTPMLEPTAEEQDAPWWREMVPSFRRATREELPARYHHGWVLDAPVIEMPRYMRWLEARVAALGGRIAQRALSSLDEAFEGGRVDAVACCAGLGARELVGDARVFAVRGQVARLRAPGVTRAILDDTGPVTYVIPRSDGVVVGGTAQERDEDLAPRAADEAAFLSRCVEIEPQLRDAPVVARSVGLRPARDVVRLERVGRVVHNYGHGGSGVTLSWGCAEEAAMLLEEAGRGGENAQQGLHTL